jgi:putative spermidine/putrescine transport system ATP-binding protein
MAFLELSDIVKRFGRNTVVSDFNLDVAEGEFVSFLGGSGCGKTTTLRMIAGFETPTSGSIVIDGRDVVGVSANKRDVGMVFQNYALFPNMTVNGNIGFGLKVAGKKPAAIAKRVAELLAIIRMEEFGVRYPHQLSGGQQQRVALARALAIEPSVLLLDEPLSALDAKIRIQLRAEIKDIQRRLGITTVYVTHDQEEALSISDRIVVMNKGKIEQIGTPFEIYNRPATPFVASFIGTLNLLEASVADPGSGKLLLDGQEIFASAPVAQAKGTRVKLAVRPEALGTETGTPDFNRIRGKLANVVFLGSIVRMIVKTKGNDISMDSFNDPRLVLPSIGEELSISFPREACIVLGAESGKTGSD